MGKLTMNLLDSSLLGRALTAAGVGAALLLSVSAGNTQGSAPFAGFDGSWSGNGTVTLSNGTNEHIRCKADYKVNSSGMGLKQALHTHGLWFGAFLTAQIEQLPAELARVGPDLVYFDADHRRDFLRRAPVTLEALDAWLGRDYDTVAVDALGGHWFHRRGARPGDVCPAVQPFHIPGRLAG